VSSRGRNSAILTACALGDHDALRASVPGRRLDGLVELAVEHRVAPLVFAALRDLRDVDPEAMRHLTAAHLDNRLRRTRMDADLRYFAEVVATTGVPWLVVKGAAVAALLYDPPETRTVGDLDVLVSPADFRTVVDALERAGHPVDDANWELVRRDLAGQLHFWLPEGSSLDLHWHLLYSRVDQERSPVRTDALLARRRPVVPAPIAYSTLDAVDTLVHLALHAAGGGGDQLSWLVDIHRASADPGVRWSAVVERARGWQVELAVGTMLLRNRAELGTPVPAWVLHDLLPRPWQEAVAALGRVTPVARSTRRWGDPVSLLTRSATRTHSARAATRIAALGLVDRGRSLLRDRSPERQERLRPDKIHQHRGGDADRRAYFDELAARPRTH
jgi:hypothetical protein